MNRSLFFNWTPFKKINTKNIILNFGPQHPAAHGVLRLVIQLEGEIIQRLDPHIGLLHRGTEKLIETKYFDQSIPYFDRLDYVSMMSQEHVYCLSIEKLLNSSVLTSEINYIRILFDELTRVLNHLLAIACHALDIGSMSSIFWAFEEREKLMEFYERVSGARMHAAFHRPVNSFNFKIEKQLIVDILNFIKDCYVTLNEMHNLLTYNKIWKQRLINIGVLSFTSCTDWGLTGVLARSVGLKRDLRLNLKDSYSGYNLLNIKSYLGVNGDTYDRYLIRMLEMGESLNICNNLALKLLNLKINPIKQEIYNADLTTYKLNSYTSMEDLITHFVHWHTGYTVKKGVNLTYIEAPKGEFGVTLHSNATAKPMRCKIRSPGYFNLQALSKLSKGHYLADLAALIGTIDIVFGEVDR